MPAISPKDPAVKELNVKMGDVIKITRNSPTQGKSEFYRVVRE
jgi:DNA-directed RNA polymerase subunit H